nr:MAG TPA: hypothetical protein [Caudoviricetes sp.]
MKGIACRKGLIQRERMIQSSKHCMKPWNTERH